MADDERPFFRFLAEISKSIRDNQKVIRVSDCQSILIYCKMKGKPIDRDLFDE